MRTVARATASALLGLLCGVVSVALGPLWSGAGLLLVVLTTATLLFGLPPGLLRTVFALGWSLAVVVCAIPRPEGDYLVSSDLTGYTLLGIGVAGVLVGLATTPLRGARSHASSSV